MADVRSRVREGVRKSIEDLADETVKKKRIEDHLKGGTASSLTGLFVEVASSVSEARCSASKGGDELLGDIIRRQSARADSDLYPPAAGDSSADAVHHQFLAVPPQSGAQRT